jgi:hypothetical protein
MPSLTLPQARETRARTRRAGPFRCRYAYARSADARAAGDTGQDFLAFRWSGRSLAFALCDGVSQSFYGDLAARFLGKALLAWLRRLPRTIEPDPIAESLSSCLQTLAGPATRAVLSHLLPAGASPLLRSVLEEKRANGSESTFACGRIDLPAPGLPDGRLVLAWMGDTRIRLWGPRGEVAGPDGPFAQERRWSSRRGPVGGAPSILAGPVRGRLARLAAWTDGFPGEWERLTNDGLRRLIAAGPLHDDLALLEIWLSGRALANEAMSQKERV